MKRLRFAVVVAVFLTAVVVPASPALAAAPSNDMWTGREVIDAASLPFLTSVNTTDATSDDDDLEATANCPGGGPPGVEASVWYELTPLDSGVLGVRTAGGDYPAGIAIVTGTPGSFVYIDCGPFGLAVDVQAGVTYHLLVFDDQTDGGGNGGQLEIQLTVADAFCGPPGGEMPATIVGSGLIKGTPGDDVIVGGSGNDRIFGYGGNDIICGLAGNDFIHGGAGNDLLIGDGDGSLPPFAGSNGFNNDTLFGGPGHDELIGLAGDDLLIGNGGDDFIVGFGGNDTAHGGPGNDEIFGGPHQDRLHGEGGDDVIYGNFDSDILNGGAGNDFLDGDSPFPGPPPFPPGGNDDVCVGGAGNDTQQNCETEVS